MQFSVIPRNQAAPSQGRNQAVLRVDHWNDYSFVTMFEVTLFDEHGTRHELGNVKIGLKGQTIQTPTYHTLQANFLLLNENYFSLATDLDYYRALGEKVSPICRDAFLKGLRDVVADDRVLEEAQEEEVFSVSLLRYLAVSAITGQYRRVLNGEAPLTDFNFRYMRPQSERYAGIELDFVVQASSKPSTNIHAIIGRNGVGKTTLLNDMINSIVRRDGVLGGFYEYSVFGSDSPIRHDYFANLVSVSFSAFDPFHPPEDRNNPDLETRYSYIGLKDAGEPEKLKTLSALRRECLSSLGECFADTRKRQRWVTAIKTLGSDENFSQMELWRLASQPDAEWQSAAAWYVQYMSAGHAIVLLTITKLVARVEEKTLVLLDEPESHLHPPLLSAFTRALSELLHSRNGVAIVATHSPVVLQEVPRSCVTVITRHRVSLSSKRPDVETFGENVGVLTREVFGLEVAKSGFHALLQEDVNGGGTYEGILGGYSGQLGMEAKGILRAMVSDAQNGTSGT